MSEGEGIVATERAGIELGRRYGDHSTSHAIEAMPRLVIGLFTLEIGASMGRFRVCDADSHVFPGLVTFGVVALSDW